MSEFFTYFILLVALPALVGLSLYYSHVLRWPQFRHFGRALGLMLGPKKEAGKMGNFAAVATIIGGNLGTGTIAGTAFAITSGGPGSIFWMAIVALVGSVVKLACALLGVRYRSEQSHGRCIGGPMFYLRDGAGQKGLAFLYCFFLIGAGLTAGNLVQISAFVDPFEGQTFLQICMVLSLAIPAAFIFCGGLKQFAAFMSFIVPIMGVFYILACLIGLFLLRHRLPDAMGSIFYGAFGLRSIGGGLAGHLVLKSIQTGVSRGLFATDIGLGLAAIAHGNVDDSHTNLNVHAAQQGLIALVAPIFVVLLCVVTGLLIVCAGPDIGQNCGKICLDTFKIAFRSESAGLFIPIIIYCFALTTILAWTWFAEHAFFFFRKSSPARCFKVLSVAILPIGAFFRAKLIWTIADICMTGLLLVNLVGLFLLRREVTKTFRQYEELG